jgi:hypothetical protein
MKMMPWMTALLPPLMLIPLEANLIAATSHSWA